MKPAAAGRRFRVRARGPVACFTRPEMKAERVSYEVMTPSAARGVLEAVLWKPAIRWHVHEIAALAPVQWTSFRRNEVNSRAVVGKLDYAADEDRAQRNTVALRDVDYVITASFTLVPGKVGAMGRKNTVPYALYRAHGFVSPHLARQTGFGSPDLELLFQSFTHMFELDRSAARGLMSMRKVIVFKHGSELGHAPAHALFDRVRAARNQPDRPARSFSDYKVEVDTSGLPQGIEAMDLLA